MTGIPHLNQRYSSRPERRHSAKRTGPVRKSPSSPARRTRSRNEGSVVASDDVSLRTVRLVTPCSKGGCRRDAGTYSAPVPTTRFRPACLRPTRGDLPADLSAHDTSSSSCAQPVRSPALPSSSGYPYISRIPEPSARPRPGETPMRRSSRNPRTEPAMGSSSARSARRARRVPAADGFSAGRRGAPHRVHQHVRGAGPGSPGRARRRALCGLGGSPARGWRPRGARSERRPRRAASPRTARPPPPCPTRPTVHACRDHTSGPPPCHSMTGESATSISSTSVHPARRMISARPRRLKAAPMLSPSTHTWRPSPLTSALTTTTRSVMRQASPAAPSRASGRSPWRRSGPAGRWTPDRHAPSTCSKVTPRAARTTRGVSRVSRTSWVRGCAAAPSHRPAAARRTGFLPARAAGSRLVGR